MKIKTASATEGRATYHRGDQADTRNGDTVILPAVGETDPEPENAGRAARGGEWAGTSEGPAAARPDPPRNSLLECVQAECSPGGLFARPEPHTWEVAGLRYEEIVYEDPDSGVVLYVVCRQCRVSPAAAATPPDEAVA